MRRFFYFIVFAICTLGLTACADSFLAEDPPHLLDADGHYTDYEGFQTGINGLYNRAVEEAAGTAFGSRASDLRKSVTMVGTDNMYGNQTSTTLFGGLANEWREFNNPEEGMYLDVWTWLYEIINAANTIVERSDNSDIEWTQDQKNRILAEARFFRAWAYRHLTYLFGPVPLTLNESKGDNLTFDWDRTPVDSVRAQMEKDWQFAKQHLPVTPPQKGKLVRGVAQHYLAELYLAQGRNAEARDEALDLIENGPFSLVTERYGVVQDQPGTPFTDMFIEGNENYSDGNTEALWVFQGEYQTLAEDEHDFIMRRYMVSRYYSIALFGVSVERGGRGIGRLSPTQWALDLYEDADDRGSGHAWQLYYVYDSEVDTPNPAVSDGDTVSIYPDTPLSRSSPPDPINEPVWPHTRKWNWAPEDNPTIARQFNDLLYLRLANTYLLLAEAQMKLGNTQDAKPGAAWAINQLRERAGASLIDPSDVTLDFILDERSRELYSEEHRRYTLLRTDTWLERTKEHNTVASPNVTERDTIFPIPQDVIDDNTQGPLEQNPGY